MKVLIDKSFEKDTSSISNPKLKTKLADLIEAIIEIDRFSNLKNVKKLKGNTISYRIKAEWHLKSFFISIIKGICSLITI